MSDNYYRFSPGDYHRDTDDLTLDKSQDLGYMYRHEVKLIMDCHRIPINLNLKRDTQEQCIPALKEAVTLVLCVSLCV